LPLAAFPIERCAAIAASIARRPPERPRLLEAHGLRKLVWQDLEEHWSAAIRDEAVRGKNALRTTYDAAYVAQLEKERGPIDARAYAALVVAAERGQSDRALADLDLPPGAMMRIRMVWLARLAKDPALAAEARGAIEDARME
jgi:hypothetical protein